MKKYLALVLFFLLSATPAFAANRFWVGGTANWDGTAGTKWALTSGGAGGQAVPGTGDDVFFDANSGAVTVSVPSTTNVNAHNVDFTGFTGTFQTGSSLSRVNSSGSLTMVTGMTIGTNNVWTFNSTASGNTITSAGKIISSATFNGVGGVWSLQDDMTLGGGLSTAAGGITLTAGTFNLNNHNISNSFGFSSSNSNVRALTLGSGTFSMANASVTWDISTATNMTLTPNISTVKLTDNSTNSVVFNGGGLTYNNIWLTGTGTGGLTVTGANTFKDFKDDKSGTHTVTLPASATQTMTTFSVSGISGHLISIISSSAGTPATISIPSGIISRDFLSIKDSTATGGATFYAGANSTNVSGNTGWIFTAPVIALHAKAIFTAGKTILTAGKFIIP